MRHDIETLVYDPKENIWRPDDMLRYVKMPTACVDDMLYYYSVYDFTKKIKTYDPKRRCWEVVKGLRKLFSKMKNLQCIHAANYGGKLALFYTSKEDYRRGRGVKSKREIWCADISLERRQGGEIWGKVEWCGQVLVADLWVKNCLNVMV
ncbi:F-box/kelch-repeat protein [Raphanus sativus]|nr:F-box/kelch-repeat protein [Raphanus sativus]